jgi:hypothetical protein
MNLATNPCRKVLIQLKKIASGSGEKVRVLADLRVTVAGAGSESTASSGGSALPAMNAHDTPACVSKCRLLRRAAFLRRTRRRRRDGEGIGGGDRLRVYFLFIDK